VSHENPPAMLPKSAFTSDADYTAYLRDWFAGKALAGIATESGVPAHGAAKAYQYADAMLAARPPALTENHRED
jgi:hypothetical protein